MTFEQWAKIKHFKTSENWGDPDKMNVNLLITLDSFREWLGMPIQINCGTQGRHVPDSFHYKGLAVDISFPTIKKGELFDVLMGALRFPFNGVGVYPHWKPHGGLHLDLRTTTMKAFWLARMYGKEQQYLNLTLEELKKDLVV